LCGIPRATGQKVVQGVTSVDLFDDETPAPATQELPIADYKHLPRIAVEASVGKLDRDDVELVLRYEREHRGRTPVIRLLTAQLRRLRDVRDGGRGGGRGSGRSDGGYGPVPREQL
jgi:hypothetical protein